MTRSRAALALCGAAVLVLLGFEWRVHRTLDPAAAELPPPVDELRGAFADRLREAEAIARCAVDRGVDAAAAGCVAEAWSGRLEGVAVADGAGDWIAWAGAPTGPLPGARGPGTVWVFRSRGMRHSLVVRTGPTEDGRVGAAWLTLESAPDADAARIRVPARWLHAGRGTLTLRPTDGVPATEAGGPSDPSVVLDDPDGNPMALLDVEAPSREAAASRLRATGRGVAAAVAALGLVVGALAFRARSRAFGEGACVVAARGILAAGGTLEALLPRALGGPSLYGAPGWGGLLGSPAALLASAAAWLWLARIAVRGDGEDSNARRRGVLSLVAAGSVAGLVWVSGGLARDGRIDVLALGDAAASAAHMALLAGLAVAALATAFLLAAGWRAWVGARGTGAALWISLVAAAVVASEAHIAAWNGITAERLQSEFAPLVAEQSARRRLALESHVAEVARSPLARDLLRRPDDPVDLSAGWALWSGGPLGLRGWLSSIDVLAEDGAVRARFAFGLPPMQEPPPAAAAGAPADRVVREETIAFGASEQRLLHAEAAIRDGDVLLGRVVAHVLDEPDNLPFLPGVAPYLSALGAPTSSRDGPDYVLYGADGQVLLSTLARPPALRREEPDATTPPAVRGERHGGTDYLALAVRQGDRVHLLLAASGGPLARAGGVARVALLEALFLSLGAAGALLWGGATPWRARGAFYRKILASMLAASLLPLLGLALVLRTSIEGGASRGLQESAADIVGAVRRVVEDYAAVLRDDDAPQSRVDDGILSWLRGIVGQEIHLYEDGVLVATSKPELFESGLVATRLPGDVREALLERGEPSVVREESLGNTSLPVAYARANLAGTPAVVAVPLVLERRAIGLAMERVLESLLLATVLLGTLLAAAAAWVARNVARPVREMVDATGRVARGDYSVRLGSRSRDELATLAEGFNTMAAALEAQRAELARSSQLAAWAEMARAIAHEIKNPLTPIQLSAEHLERLLRDRGAIPDADLEACLRAILGQVRALREIAGEFSAYAKLPDLAPEPTALSAFVRDAMAPYRAALPEGIRLEERYEARAACAVDRRSLGRAMANLVENALHAMPGGGVLRVSTADDPPVGEAFVTVEDTGTGLSPEARVRLFEPYFSTKTSGTGLGLAIVLRTVEAHRGRIDVDSQQGRGTSFRIRLPVAS